MRLATVRRGQGSRAARVDGDVVTELPASDVGTLLSAGPSAVAMAARANGPSRPLVIDELAPVIPCPGKIICLGLNHRPHVREMDLPVPRYPTLFAKFARALIGPRDDILLPRFSRALDWEAELAVVIGQPLRHANEKTAIEAIAGVTILNDISARDIQLRTTQWLQGKTLERTSPMGPWLVTRDEFEELGDVILRCEVNGDVMQEAPLSELIFQPASALAYISHIITLDPGDIVSMGTPAGVGHGRIPQVYLRHGDVIRTEIRGVGELINRCVDDVDSSSTCCLPPSVLMRESAGRS